MKDFEKQVEQSQLNSEKQVLKDLKVMYQEALDSINEKIMLLQTDPLSQSKAYQVEFQKVLKSQIETFLDLLHDKEFDTIEAFLKESYDNGYIGAMYALQAQGIPLILPINQQQVVKAIQLDSKISKGLYEGLGENIKDLKNKIRAEVTRGISTGMGYTDIARNISNVSNTGLNNAMRIARTESHSIKSQASYNAALEAKKKGADVLLQWDATLDSKTRKRHREVDGEIIELGETFSNGLRYAGDRKGGASEVVNCRCTCLTRARWALDEEELETLKERAKYYKLDKSKNFEDYKEKYLKATDKYYGGIPKTWELIDSDDDAVKNANPNYKLNTDDGYSKNCPNCAIAYEFRRRGYDVIAKPYIKGGSHYLNNKPWEAWEGVEVNDISSYADFISIIDKYSDGSRFGICYLKNNNQGHVIVGEKTDGKMHLYDPQSGKKINTIDFETVNGVKLWKTNELVPTDRGITACEGR